MGSGWRRIAYLTRVKCALCKKTIELHKADTLECPDGKKTRIGYTSFGPEKFTMPTTKTRSKS